MRLLSIRRIKVSSPFIYAALSRAYRNSLFINMLLLSQIKFYSLSISCVIKKDSSSNFPLWNSCSILASQLEGCWNTHCFHTPFVTKWSSSHFKLTRRVFWGWDIAWSPRTWVKRTRWTSRAEARIESKTSHTKLTEQVSQLRKAFIPNP